MRGLTPAEVAELCGLSGPPGESIFTDDATEERLLSLMAQGRVSHFILRDEAGEWDCYKMTPAGRAALELHFRLTAEGAL